MTKQEFETRAKIEVTDQEYIQVIEPMYMTADVDKDEFCNLWVKMNHKRVDAAIKERNDAEKQERLKDRLFNLYTAIRNRCEKLNQSSHLVNAENVLNSREMKLLEDAGIEYRSRWITDIWSPLGKRFRTTTASDIRFELHKKYGFAY